jgi:TorA maturation chaperone TorD
MPETKRTSPANAEQTGGVDQDLVQLMQGRQATYGLLARMYRKEVDQAFLDELCAMRFPQDTGNEDMDRGYRLIHDYLCQVWERSLDELAVDYMRVFIGSGQDAHSAAYPTESVHTSSRRLMMEAARTEVLAIYRANGLDKSQFWKETEDHITIELEFMQILGGRIVDDLKAGKEDKATERLRTQYNFLEEHLRNWVPLLNADIQHFAQTDFYRGLGFLTLGFLDVDKGFLEELLGIEASDE